MATSVLGLKTFAASDPVDYNEVNDNYTKIDNGVKTAMQGRAAHNLLVNSDFRIAQAGYGGNHGSKKYACDRWYDTYGFGSFSFNELQGLTVAYGTNHAYLVQNIEDASRYHGKTMTMAFGLSDGTIRTANGVWLDNALSFKIDFDNGYAILHPNRVELVVTSGSLTVKWAALYEGSYTADTLPAYVPKGYAAELAECQLYHLPLNHQLLGSGYTFQSGAALLVPRKMRIDAPSFVASGTIIARVNGADYPLTLSSVTTYGSMIKVDFASNNIPVNYPCAFYSDAPGVSLNADL